MLRFRKRAVLALPWLSEEEWKARFKHDLQGFGALLDDSGATVLGDLGGFRYLVQDAIWVPDMVRICRSCGVLLPIESFRMNNGVPRLDCTACESKGQMPRSAKRRSLAHLVR